MGGSEGDEEAMIGRPVPGRESVSGAGVTCSEVAQTPGSVSGGPNGVRTPVAVGITPRPVIPAQAGTQ